MISNLATMLSAGISILEAVDSLLADAKGNQKKVLKVLRDDLMQGQHVYVTFSRFPRVFDTVAVNIIKASEEAGTLDETLKQLVENIRKEMEFSDKVRAALIYPLFIMVVFVGVLLMILIVVVPKISSVFTRLNVDLPLPTRVMMFFSDLLLHYTAPVILGVVIILTGLVVLYKTQKRAMLNGLSSLPILSNLARNIDLTRFTRSMHFLLSAGIPITTALDLSQNVVNKRDVAKAILKAKEAIVGGKKISDGFKSQKNVIPSILIKITEAGERTGSLDTSMKDAADYLDYQTSSNLKTITALLEPVMLVIVGGLVGGMMLAIIAPIYSLIGQVASR